MKLMAACPRLTSFLLVKQQQDKIPFCLLSAPLPLSIFSFAPEPPTSPRNPHLSTPAPLSLVVPPPTLSSSLFLPHFALIKPARLTGR